MAPDGRELIQPKESNNNNSKKQLDLYQYEALLNNVRFEWQAGPDMEQAIRELKTYLLEHTKGYRIEAFYLKNEDPWA